jgi:predicted esterase
MARPERLALVPRRALAAVAGVLVAAPIAAFVGADAFYLVANGPGVGAVALGVIPVVLAGVPVLAWAWRRPLAAAMAGLLAADALFAGVRVARVDPGGAIAYRVDGEPAPGPLIARLVREDESARAGFTVAHALGVLSDAEYAAIGPVTDAKYRALDGLRDGVPGVDALLLRSTPARVESLVYEPPGDAPAPCLVFLHGFGGALTTYVSALLESDALAGYVIVAPALDNEGRWWSADGLAVVRRTLDTLPPRADRGRVFLVGLSNGGIGASAIAADRELAPRFRAAAGLVGGDSGFGTPRIPFRLFAGARDPRFPIAYLEDTAAALSTDARPVELVRFDADHLALFTDTAAVDDAIAGWLAANGG